MSMRNKLLEQILAAIGGGSQTQEIVDVNSIYTALPKDDVLICNGTFTVTLTPLASATKQITIRALTGSTITLAASGGNSFEASASPVTSGTSVTLVPTSNGWLII